MKNSLLNIINTNSSVTDSEEFKKVLLTIEKDCFNLIQNNLKEGIHSFFYSHHNIRLLTNDQHTFLHQEKYIILFLEVLLKNIVIQELFLVRFDVFSKTVFFKIKDFKSED